MAMKKQAVWVIDGCAVGAYRGMRMYVSYQVARNVVKVRVTTRWILPPAEENPEPLLSEDVSDEYLLEIFYIST